MITRQEYLADSKTLHRAYYRQFVTPTVSDAVRERITIKRLLESTDPHLNDIPLTSWDGVAYNAYMRDGALVRQVRETGDCNPRTLSVGVCIAKEAARILIEESDRGNN